MKILHINSYYASSKFYKNLYEEQVTQGIDINVYVPISLNIENDFDYGYYTLLSNNHKPYHRVMFHLKHHKILKDVRIKYNINNYNLIHAHSLFSNGYIAMMLKKAYGIPYIVAVRNTDVNLFFGKMLHLRGLGNEILNNAEKVIFLSKPYRDFTIKNFVPESQRSNILNKVSVIPNGIDEFWFRNIVMRKSRSDDKVLRLIQVGDINKNKNVETTIKAVLLLFQMGYDVQLDLVGKIKDKRLFKVVDSYSFVNYHGFKTKEELIEIYKNNDIFILPSKHETFGLVYAEAMSQGLPVIYTKNQGFDGYFDDGEVGFSVDCYDEVDLVYKIIGVLDKYFFISNNCALSLDKFNWSNISNDYALIYERCFFQQID